jgi:putative heme iron utilization protein
MDALLELLDTGGVSVWGAAKRLGMTEGQALAVLGQAGRCVCVDGKAALATVRGWGRLRVILRAGSSVAEVMSDLGAAVERREWLNDEDDRVHLHLDTSDIGDAWVIAKAGHATGRATRLVCFIDGAGEVLFKVMVPKERTDLVAPFNALRGKGGNPS